MQRKTAPYRILSGAVSPGSGEGFEPPAAGVMSKLDVGKDCGGLPRFHRAWSRLIRFGHRHGHAARPAIATKLRRLVRWDAGATY